MATGCFSVLVRRFQAGVRCHIIGIFCDVHHSAQSSRCIAVSDELESSWLGSSLSDYDLDKVASSAATSIDVELILDGHMPGAKH